MEPKDVHRSGVYEYPALFGKQRRDIRLPAGPQEAGDEAAFAAAGGRAVTFADP